MIKISFELVGSPVEEDELKNLFKEDAKALKEIIKDSICEGFGIPGDIRDNVIQNLKFEL